MINAKIIKLVGDKSEFQCVDCMKIFSQKVNVATHIEAKHIFNPAGVTCELCGNVCSTRQGLRKHMYRYHPTKSVA